MDKQIIRDKLIIILEHIQCSGNYATPVLTGATRPLEDLDGFDSQMGVTATGLLAAALGISIPAGRNVFRVKGGTRALTIDEIVEVLFGLASVHVTAGAEAPPTVSPVTP